MKDNTCSTDALELFNKGTVISSSERIHVFRADKGTEFTSAAYRQFCLDIGIQLQFASPNTPEQIGANERAGRTIMNIVRFMLADSTLPSLLWEELMHTAVYLSNRTPHAALHNWTPCKALYGKDAHLAHLRVVGARAFVHGERTPKSWKAVRGKDGWWAAAWTANLTVSTTLRRDGCGRVATLSSLKRLPPRLRWTSVVLTTGSSLTPTRTT